jgi:hypothetical protein
MDNGSRGALVRRRAWRLFQFFASIQLPAATRKPPTARTQIGVSLNRKESLRPIAKQHSHVSGKSHHTPTPDSCDTPRSVPPRRCSPCSPAGLRPSWRYPWRWLAVLAVAVHRRLPVSRWPRATTASGVVEGLVAGTGTAPRRESAATLESEPEMNTTGNRRQVELLGSSVSSAMRCPSSKHSVCQSKRRVRAVSTTARPIRRGHGAPEN